MAHQVLNVGIISREDYMKRTIAIAKGKYKPSRSEPKIWFESISAMAQVFSNENQELLKVIIQQKPDSIATLAKLTGQTSCHLSQTLEKMANYGIIELENQSLKPTVIATDFKIEFSMGAFPF
jgi:predicted transcriptional regulator